MASSLERQSPRVASCLTHSLCPGEPSLQTTAVVSMGSADHQFNLVEILSQNYGIRQECDQAAGDPGKPEGELEKDFISQSSDMPLDELLALYGYEASDPISERESEGSDTTANLPDMTLDKEQIAKDLLSGEEEEETQSSADDLTPSVTSHEASDLFPNRSGPCFLADGDKEPGSSTSSDTEEDPLPANKCKKEIMVGPQFQADLSSLHLDRHGEKIYENDDQLLWDPNVLPEREVEEFLYRAVKRRWHEMAGSQLPEGETVKDSEQALYELVKCNFNAEEALRRLRFNVKVIRDGFCAWSEEECRNFEHGFRVHGKNFHLIQANKVRVWPALLPPGLHQLRLGAASGLGAQARRLHPPRRLQFGERHCLEVDSSSLVCSRFLGTALLFLEVEPVGWCVAHPQPGLHPPPLALRSEGLCFPQRTHPRQTLMTRGTAECQVPLPPRPPRPGSLLVPAYPSVMPSARGFVRHDSQIDLLAEPWPLWCAAWGTSTWAHACGSVSPWLPHLTCHPVCCPLSRATSVAPSRCSWGRM
uniref:MIER family member 2 n=1 Tax=Lynx canadensis TaxID=61383 RepID=A0A667H5M8_LYNCA